MSDEKNFEDEVKSLKFENSRKTEKLTKLQDDYDELVKTNESLDKDIRAYKYDAHEKTGQLEAKAAQSAGEALRYKLMLEADLPSEAAVMVTAHDEETIKGQIEYVKKYSGKPNVNVKSPNRAADGKFKGKADGQDANEMARNWAKEHNISENQLGLSNREK